MPGLATIQQIFRRLASRLRRINGYVAGMFMIATAVAAGSYLPERTAISTVGIILLMAVLANAALHGVRPGLVSGLIAGLAYDFFFIPPVYSLDIEDWRHALALLIFCLASAAVSILAENLRERAVIARRREMLSKRLSVMDRHLGRAGDILAIAETAVANVGVALGARAVLFLRQAGSFKKVAAHPVDALLDGPAFDADAQWQRHEFRKIGDAHAGDGVTCTFLPMDPDSGICAMIVVGETQRRFWRLPDRTRMLDSFAGRTAAALQRVTLSRKADDARIAAETEKTRSALLMSISHDLKTPLSIILGSASSLQALNSHLSAKSARELVDAIQEEGERLEQFIANLLDMSRVESEAILPKRLPVELGDIVGSALQRAGRILAGHRIVLQLPATLPMAELDPVLMEKVLFNIFENAAKYTPVGGQVTVAAAQDGATIVLRILDDGAGIPEADLPHLFEKFYRVETGEWKPAGTGLGLAICRGFLTAMGASISASNRPGRKGAVFTIRLPIASKQSRSASPGGLPDSRASFEML